jgi:hypothetical protein|tara:strand:+ start:366 stop:788 length:423 start_codon:yes stop_codon:yes gene_type:complete
MVKSSITTHKGIIMNLEALRTAALECITAPNELLPEGFHDDVRGGRTLARLEEMCEVRDGITEHVKRQQAKARNIEKLRKQVEEKSVFAETKAGKQFVDLDSELDYSDNEIDDLQLTKNMMALVAGMVNGGVLDADDLEE